MRILIVKMSSLGDIVQSFPILQHLKNLFPNATIDWLVEKRFLSLIESAPHINNALAIDTKSLRKEFKSFFKELRLHKYDYVFDIQGNCKSALMTLFAKAKQKVGFSYSTLPEWPNGLVTNYKVAVDLSQSIYSQYLSLVSHPFEKESIQSFSSIYLKVSKDEKRELDLVDSPFYVVCFASRWENKELEDCALVKTLQLFKKPTLIAYLGEEEKIRAQLIAQQVDQSTLMGDLSIGALQYLMRKSLGVISIDSLTLHIAAIANVPTFSIFGPSSSQVYAPIGNMHGSYQGSCPYFMSFKKRCKKLRHCNGAPCMKTINPQHLAKQLHDWSSLHSSH